MMSPVSASSGFHALSVASTVGVCFPHQPAEFVPDARRRALGSVEPRLAAVNAQAYLLSVGTFASADARY